MRGALASLGALVLAAAGGMAACSGAARVPPGLPPPEYEKPPVMPWPPADAGAVPHNEDTSALGAAGADEPLAASAAALGGAGAPGE